MYAIIMSKNIYIFKGNYIAIYWWQGLGSIFVIHEVVITGLNKALLASRVIAFRDQR